MNTDRSAGWLFCLLLAVYTLTMSGHFYTPDEYYKHRVAQSLVEHGTLRAAEGATNHTDSRGYSYFPLGQSLLYAPVHLAVRGAAALAPIPVEAASEFCCAWLSCLASALLLTFLYLLLRGEGVDRRAALLVVVCGAFGTMIWPYARYSFGEPVVAACLFAAVWLLRRRDGDEAARIRRVALAGVLFGFGTTVRIEYVLAAPLIFSLDVLPDLRPRGALFAIGRGIVLAAATGGMFGINLAYNQARYGDPLDFGQVRINRKPGASDRPVIGAGAAVVHGGAAGAAARSGLLILVRDYAVHVLFSPAKSLPLYSPMLLLLPLALVACLRRRAWLGLHLLLVGLVLSGFYAARGSSVTGWTWGPRYLYCWSPLGLFFLAWLVDRPRWRRVAALLLVAGAMIQLPGVLSSMNVTFEHLVLGEGRIRPREEWLWQPRHTLIWRNTLQLRESWRGTPELLRARGTGELARMPAAERILRIRRNTFDLWFLYAWFYGLPRGPIVAAVVALLLLALLALWRLRLAYLGAPDFTFESSV